MTTVALHADTFGETTQPPVVILHGLFGSSSNWRSIARKLAENYWVHCLDLRNHGRSPWQADMQYRVMSGDVAAYITANHLQSPHVIGHSMGGKTAMSLVQEFDLPLGKTAIIDIAPVVYTHDHHALITAMLAIDLQAAPSRQTVDTELARSVPELGLRQFLMHNLARSESGFAWRTNLNEITKNMNYIVGYESKKVKDNPIYFIAGSDSDYVLPRHHTTIKQFFPNAKIDYIDGTNHWLHQQNPARLIELLLQYL